MRGQTDIRVSNGDLLGALRDFAKQVAAWAVKRPKLIISQSDVSPAPCPGVVVFNTPNPYYCALPDPARYPGELITVVSRQGASITVWSVSPINNTGTVTVTSAAMFVSDGVYWWQV